MSGQGLGSRAIIGTFYEMLEAYLGRSWVGAVSMHFDSDQESETYKWLGMPPALREWIGGRQAKGLRENGLTIENKKWESTLGIPVDWLRRDKTGQIRIRIGELAERGAEHDAKLLSLLIDAGETGLCYDGQAFFDTDHAEGDSGTQTNDLAVGDYGELAVTVSTNPTAAEMNTVIMKIIQHMLGLKDDQGEPFNALARQFLVMVPVPYMGAAVGAVYNQIMNASGGAYDNPLAAVAKSQDFSISVAVNPRLTWTTKLAVFRTDAQAKPLIVQEEEPLSVSAIAEGSEEEFKNDQHLYGVKRISNVGYGYWQHACMATLSDA